MKAKKKTMFISGIIMIILICIAFTIRVFQNDTFYTIKVGESILKNGIDMIEHFSWHNLAYTYPHWLYDIIIYKVYNAFDFNGLYVFTILCFMVVGIAFYLINISLNKSYFLSLLFSVLMVIMLANYSVARAQLFTYLLFVLEIFFIERLLSSSKKRYMIFLGIICILIANLHAAVWPFYFILMLPYLFEQLVYVINKKVNFKGDGVFVPRLVIEDRASIKLLVIVFVVSLGLGLLTPIGDTPYTYFFKIFMGDTMDYIEEHQPLILIENAFVFGYLVVLLVPLIFTKVKIKISDIAMICGLVFMAFLSVRHISFLAVVGIFYLCRLYCNLGKINDTEPLDFVLPVWGSLVVLVTVIGTSLVVFNINSSKEYINTNIYPVSMVDYIYDNLDVDKIKLYNEYDFGSYLIYRDLPVYIDSRSDLYTKPFNNKFDIFNECMNITSNYGRVFNKYDITHILIYKDTDLNQILSASDNYEVVHKDGRFVLYEYLGRDKDNDSTSDGDIIE